MMYIGSNSVSLLFTGQINTNKAGLDIDGVWSIRQNVNIGMPHNKQQDSLTFNVNKNYYSRYGGNKGL